MKIVASLFFFGLLVTYNVPAQEKQSVKSKVLMTCFGFCDGSCDLSQERAQELWRLIEDGNTEHLDAFMLEMQGTPVDAHYQGPHSGSLLNWAIHRGKVKVLQFLLDGGASLITPDGQYPLVAAARCTLPTNRHDMIKALLKANANPLKANVLGFTALSHAHTIKDVTACKIMIEAIVKRRMRARSMVTHILSTNNFMPPEIAESIAQFAFPKP